LKLPGKQQIACNIGRFLPTEGLKSSPFKGMKNREFIFMEHNPLESRADELPEGTNEHHGQMQWLLESNQKTA